MVYEEELYERLEHLRRWNRIHPDKRIHIAGHDLEFDYRTTLRSVIIPYFQSFSPSFNIEGIEESKPENGRRLLDGIDELLKEARSKNLIGPFPFLTPEYIEGVLENLKSSFTVFESAFGGSGTAEEDIRIPTMVRNLTNPGFLGKYFREGKVVMYGGDQHAYAMEGRHLALNFEPTKGKVAPIRLRGIAQSLGPLKDVELNLNGYGVTYHHLQIVQMQKAYQQGLIGPEKYYLSGPITDFEKLIIKKAYLYEHRPLLVTNVEWERFLEETELSNSVRMWQDEFKLFDAYIFVPRTGFTRWKTRQ
jgi:hypothetical protein